MYIPITYFSQQEACITASVTISHNSGSVSSGSYISGSSEWKWIQIYNNTTVNNVSRSLQVVTASINIEGGRTNQAKLLLVGGGGGGAATDCYKNGDCGNIAGGGGGGGGVVYYQNFPIYSGSYTVYVGPGGHSSDNLGGYLVDQNHTQQISASIGGDTIFLNQKSITYTPFTSSQLTAYGGGAGGQYWTVWSGGPGSQLRQDLISADSGGSGGGAARGSATAFNVGGGTSIGVDLGGLNGADQGNNGGNCYDGSSTWIRNGAAGGGGAMTTGSSIYSNPYSGSSYYAQKGGDGISFNLKNTAEYYSAGGYGAIFNDAGTGVITGSNALGAGSLGSGGNGGVLGWFGSPGQASTPGQNGTIILVYPNYCSQKNYTVYKMQNCCDSGSFYQVAVANNVTFGLGWTIFNPSVNQCMKSVEVLEYFDSVNFTITSDNYSTYTYGTDSYGGNVQCLNCRQANGLSGCLPITNACETWTFRYTANLPNPPSTVTYVDCTTGNTLSFTLSPSNRNGSACVRIGTTPTWGANITATDTNSYCGLY